jgi:hypothetical protein
LRPGVVDTISADVEEVKTDLAGLADEAHGRWQVQLDALQSALAGLGAAVRGLIAKPDAEAVSGVQAARDQVGAAARSLQAAANTSCPSATPTS